MRNLTPVYLLLIISCFSSCLSNSYLQNGLHINSNEYRAVPLKSDVHKSATYASGVFSAGGANENLRDGSFSLRLGIHRGHNFGNLNAYYGASVIFGDYSLGNYDYNSYRSVYDTTGNHYLGGPKFYGGYGVNGGISVVIPFGGTGERGEWRALGIEGTLQNEFGNYLSFRQKLPDSSADIIARKALYATVGISTEIITKSRRGTSFGYKFAAGPVLVPSTNYNPDIYGSRNYIAYYFSNTFHITKDNVTGFCQINFGSYAANVQLGVNFHLGNRKDKQ